MTEFDIEASAMVMNHILESLEDNDVVGARIIAEVFLRNVLLGDLSYYSSVLDSKND